MTIINSEISGNGNWGVNFYSGSRNVKSISTSVINNAKGVRMRKYYTNCGLENLTSIIDDTSCTPACVLVSDPMLLPFSNNGGFSLTHSISASSPALDGGSNSICLPVDQRGFVRPGAKKSTVALCDIGAVEVQ